MGVLRPRVPTAPWRPAIAAGAGAVALVALTVLVVGWGAGVAEVRSVIPHAATMKALTAVALGAAATSVLLSAPGRSPRAGAVARTAACLCALIGLLALVEHASGLRLGIDELPFRDVDGRASGVADPGRPSVVTALCLLLLGGALVLLDARPAQARWRPAELLALPVVLLGGLSLAGYAYGIPAFYGPGAVGKTAVSTAACLVVLGLGVLLARPHGRLLGLLTSPDPGAVLLRRLVPAFLAGPFVLGWVALRLEELAVLDPRMAAWLLAAATSVVLLAVLGRAARATSRADVVRRASEARLDDLANHDALTGLPNRHRFEEDAGALLHRVQRYGARGCLLLIDLDALKGVNDRLGHGAGDELLRGTAEAIRGRLRRSDVAARLGGDEFAVLLPDSSAAEAVEAARGVLAAVSAVVVRTPAGVGRTTASIGVAELLASDTSPARVLEDADAAMYLAKRSGGGRSRVHAPPPPALPVA